MSRTEKDFPCGHVLEAHTAQPGILDNGSMQGQLEAWWLQLALEQPVSLSLQPLITTP